VIPEVKGRSKTTVAWSLDSGNHWQLSASSDAADFCLALDGDRNFEQERVRGKVNLSGRWRDQRIGQLSTGNLMLVGDDLALRAELADPIPDPNCTTPFPIEVQAAGRLEELAGVLHSWTQKQLRDVEGKFEVNANAKVSGQSAELTSAAVRLSSLRVGFADGWFGQDRAAADFRGSWSWPSGVLQAKTLTAQCDGLLAGARGRVGPGSVDLEIAWRADLERLSDRFDDKQKSDLRSAQTKQPTRTVATMRRQTMSHEWELQGACRGRWRVAGSPDRFEIRGSVVGEKLVLSERMQGNGDASDRSASSQPTTGVDSGDEHDITPGSTADAPFNSRPQQRVVWAERKFEIDGSLVCDARSKMISLQSLDLSNSWMSASLQGDMNRDTDKTEWVLVGPIRADLPKLSQRLSRLTGVDVRLEGEHVAPFKLRVELDEQGNMQWIADGTIGWESGKVAGVDLGGTSIPLRLVRSKLQVLPCVIPACEGTIKLAGDVSLLPGPVTIRLQPGTVAESIHLTKEMTVKWLNRLAPPLMRPDRIHGTIGAEIDQATIVLGSPGDTSVTGRVFIEQLETSMTPLARELMGALRAIQSIANRKSGNAFRELDPVVVFPKQTVEFDLNLGFVHHENLLLEVDRTSIVSRGYSTLDGRLAVIARVPKHQLSMAEDASDSESEFLTLPVSGTVFQPIIDPTGIRSVTTLLTNRAPFRTAKDQVQGQLESSESLIENTGELLKDGKQLIDSLELLRDSLQRTIDGVQARRDRRESRTE
jgi:hypothetical protein